MFSVDGVEYNVFCDITREAEIKASSCSGMLLNKRYFNDPLATYLKYTINMVVPVSEMAAYAELYDILIDPVAEHRFVLPYNNTFIGFDARVETVSDRYYKKGGTAVWRGTQFTVIVNDPVRLPA